MVKTLAARDLEVLEGSLYHIRGIFGLDSFESIQLIYNKGVLCAILTALLPMKNRDDHKAHIIKLKKLGKLPADFLYALLHGTQWSVPTLQWLLAIYLQFQVVEQQPGEFKPQTSATAAVWGAPDAAALDTISEEPQPGPVRGSHKKAADAAEKAARDQGSPSGQSAKKRRCLDAARGQGALSAQLPPMAAPAQLPRVEAPVAAVAPEATMPEPSRRSTRSKRKLGDREESL